MNKYLLLYSYNILVAGRERSAIYSLHKGFVVPIPSTMASVLKELRQLPIEQIRNKYADERDTFDEYVDFLLKEKLAFITTTPELFPPMRLEYLRPEVINCSIVELTDRYDFRKLIGALSALNCKVLEIRISAGNHTIDFLNERISITKKSTIRHITLFIDNDVFYYRDILQIVENNKKIGLVVVFNSNSKSIHVIDNCKVLYLTDSMEETSVKALACDFPPIANIEFFTESLQRNPAYNQKLFVAADGSLKNDITSRKSFGNVNHSNIEEVVATREFQKIWYRRSDIERAVDELQFCSF